MPRKDGAGKAPNGTPLRYGLIGAGCMGRGGHLEVLKHVDGVEIAALTDSFPSNLAKAVEAVGHTVPAYADYRDMLAREALDAVVIATPNDTHADIACDALAAGLHVLAEKPMSSTLEGCNRLLHAAEAAETIYQVGLELRYKAIWQRVYALIQEGRIGRVRQLWCKEFRGPWGLKVGQWITQKQRSGGALVEKDCHHFDLFNWFAGDVPRSVAAFGAVDLVYGAERFEGVTPDVLDSAQVLVQFRNGAMAALMLCMYCTGYREGLEIGVIGTEGWMIANTGRKDRLRIASRGSGDEETVDFTLPPDVRKLSHSGAVYLEHLAFAENIRANNRPATDACVAWWSTVPALAAERAIEEQRVVSLDEFGPAPRGPG